MLGSSCQPRWPIRGRDASRPESWTGTWRRGPSPPQDVLVLPGAVQLFPPQDAEITSGAAFPDKKIQLRRLVSRSGILRKQL